MIYFSELQGKKILTEDYVEIGRLEDLIFLASGKPLVKKLVIRAKSKEKLIVPVEFLKRINNFIFLAKNYFTANLEENELYLVKNLLDKQIIDIKGNKIVRVNDVAIQEKGKFYLMGVDVGVLGILRWLKFEDLIFRLLSFFHIKIASQFLSWGDIQPLELTRGEVRLKKKEEKLKRIRPEDLADYLEKSNIENVRKFLQTLGEKRAGGVIGELNLNYQSFLFKNYSSEKSAKLLQFVDPSEAVDILLTLSKKKRKEILNFLPKEKKDKLNYLIKYSTTPIGNLLKSEFITVYPDDLVKEVILKIRKETTDFTVLDTIYVVNKQNQLMGVFNLHELLLQRPETPVYKFMIQNIVTVHLLTPLEIVFNKMVKYNLNIIPVVDKNNLILGIVDVLDVTAILLHKEI